MRTRQTLEAAIASLLVAVPLAAQSVSPAEVAPAAPSTLTWAASPQSVPDSAALPRADSAYQQAGPVAAAPARASERSIGPTRANSAVGLRATQPTTAAAMPTPAASDPRSPAMMIVGGAAILVGAVVGGNGGTVIMVGGAVLGLVGLWDYLQ